MGADMFKIVNYILHKNYKPKMGYIIFDWTIQMNHNNGVDKNMM